MPAGQAVFHQGDPADRFYVIETGAADVVGDGRLVTTLGPGEGFGEIALLRRVRRTATVRAATDLELQALSCDRFLPVVTGFPPSSGEARAEVEEMLGRFSPGESDDDQNRSGAQARNSVAAHRHFRPPMPRDLRQARDRQGPWQCGEKLHLAGGDVQDIAVGVGEPDGPQLATHRGDPVLPFRALKVEGHEFDALGA